MTIRIIVYVLSLLIAGCGYTYRTKHVETYAELMLGKQRGTKVDFNKTLPSCDSDFLTLNWGQPNSIHQSADDKEVWTYNNGYRWVGAAILVLIPAPIFVPLGKEKINFTIQNGAIVSVTHETTEVTFVYLPLVNEYQIPLQLERDAYENFLHGCYFEAKKPN